MRLAYLEKIDPARKMSRFYAICVTPTLFGQWALVREWGRIGQAGAVRENLKAKVRPAPQGQSSGGKKSGGATARFDRSLALGEGAAKHYLKNSVSYLDS